MWGKYSFDYACSMVRGLSRGIISMWDPAVFSKENIWCNDNYVIVQEAQVFNKFVADSGLLEMMMGGKSFTWMNKLGTKMSKLDRFLLSEEVLDDNYNLKAIVLDRLWSDHIPILLHTLKTNYGLIPFKFFHSWFHMKDIDVVVKQAFVDTPQAAAGSNVYFHEKIKFIKYRLKNCNSEFKKNKVNRKKDAIALLQDIDHKIDSSVASDYEKETRLQLLHEIHNIDRIESMDLFQKARIKWDIEGDENTKFFHSLIKQNKRRQDIQGIMVDGTWVSNPVQVKEAFLDFYKEKFLSHVPQDLFKDDIELFVSDFFATARLPPGTNSSFITLNPKSAFISDRQILDGPSMLSEIMEWCKQHKKKMMIFKVDFEKAFDSVNWKYLDYGLSQFRFGEKCRSWIRECLRSARTSILVNGSPTSEFSIKMGLRQGDPLSQFLFILIMEGLHIAIKDATRSNLIKGVTIGNHGMRLSHFFYDNDVVLVTEWNQVDMDNIIRLLNVFYLASSLHININKFDVYEIKVSNNDIEGMARITGCSTGSFPFTYLGLPIGSSMKQLTQWQSLVDKFEARLSRWKAKLLSIDGFGSLKAFNLALLQNWRWRLVSNPNLLWVRVIKAIHEEEAGLTHFDYKSKGAWANIIDTINNLHSKNIIPSNTLIYKVGCGSQVNILIWRIRLDMLPHRLILSRRGLDIHSIDCLVCSNGRETIDHIFYLCDVALNIWRMVRVWVDLDMPSLYSHSDWESWFDNIRVSNEVKKRIQVITASTWWII
nr:putative RNA-directed DNA polymerase, eukaryota, reverse transcriptase zinc-binding domain protein [Tanacetum cinerariifolium]